MLEIGSVVDATIERIEPYGLFLKSGDEPIFVDGANLCWSSRTNSVDTRYVGDQISVLVLRYNYQERTAVGSLKHVFPEHNPYRKLSRLPPGTVFHGTVQHIHKDSITMLLDGGAVGLIQKADKAAHLLPGQEFEVTIESLEVDDGQLYLRVWPGQTEA